MPSPGKLIDPSIVPVWGIGDGEGIIVGIGLGEGVSVGGIAGAVFRCVPNQYAPTPKPIINTTPIIMIMPFFMESFRACEKQGSPPKADGS